MKVAILLFLVSVLQLSPQMAQSQFVRPVLYFTFDESNPVKSAIGTGQLDTFYYQCPLINRPSEVGKGADFSGKPCIAVTNAFSSKMPKAVSVEFLFKGKKWQFLSFPQQLFNVILDESGIYFNSTSSGSGNGVTDAMVVKYTGKGKLSYSYLADGNWHHIVLVADAISGKKEIWIDGELPKESTKKIASSSNLIFPEMDGFKEVEYLDEIAFYQDCLTAQQIKQHYAEFTNGKHYSFEKASVAMKARNVIAKDAPPIEINGGYDVKEFAPGYPEYTIQALEQLRSFPDPRYKNGVMMFRNFPWTDITYLNRQLTGKGGRGFGKSDAGNAVAIVDEMVRHWNYYIELPCIRADAENALKKYSDPNTVEGALVRYANLHPEFPVSTILLQVQNRPEHIGGKQQGAYVNAQNLPEKYYLKDEKGQPIIYQNRKWLSPQMPLDIIQKDAEISRHYISLLQKSLSRPIDFINENGEVFGNNRPESLWEMDPEVKSLKKRSGLNNNQFNGRFQFRLDSVYKSEILKLPSLKNSKFTFYNTSAVQAAYWPDYATRRTINSTFNGKYYSTPDFYPAYPDNWRNARGALNGYGTISQGRKIEIALGDKLFSPFIAAGWEAEEKNIRPAQWLALLKSMVMLGADFFYTGYFNVTGPDGKWPNGVGPNDPRGYIYQVAMPSYAQAIASYAKPFFTEGELLNPSPAFDIERQFRFKGNNDNELILVRKYGGMFLIYGSVQTESNFAGAVSSEVATKIILENKTIKFNIRRQGSMYIYSPDSSRPVFYQLDSWHQYEHPFYWSKTGIYEAEVYGASNSKNKVITKQLTDSSGDFSKFITWISINSSDVGNGFGFHFESRINDRNRISILARSVNAVSQMKISYTDSLKTHNLRIDSNEWKWYLLPLELSNSRDGNNQILIECESGGIEIDKLKVSNL